jgi:hypothetical protein
MPGYHVQKDVKFLLVSDYQGHRINRIQYTAVDDSTQIRVLKIYTHHTQANAMNFLDYVVKKLSFRIKYIQTDVTVR